MLDAKAQHTLEMPFSRHEHKFIQGNIYLDKQAIRRRLSLVDPNWYMTAPEFHTAMNDVIVVRGELVVCGVARSAYGTGIITTVSKNKDTGEYIPLSPFEVSRQTAKAFKSAQSDLLPRCAVQFGVGAYLTSKPTSIKDHNRQFDEWLKSLTQDQQPEKPAHWAHNGGGERVRERMKELGLTWEMVADHVEAGKTLTRLSDTSLTFEQFMTALDTFAN